MSLRLRCIRINHIRKKIIFKASITIEAALIIPIFISSIMFFVDFFGLMQAHRQMQYIGESICQQASMYSYLNNLKNKNEIVKDSIDKLFLREIGVSTLILKAKNDNNIKDVNNVLPIVLFDDKEEIIKIIISYKYRRKANLLGFKDVNQKVVSSRRYFTGMDSRKKQKEENNEDDEWVYIGKTSTRYHLSPHCHYLSNDIKPVEFKAISHYRNINGGKYHPCASCIEKGNIPNTVYIMDSGNVYHSTKKCKSINAYVEKVRKSSVEYMGLCSYCEKHYK